MKTALIYDAVGAQEARDRIHHGDRIIVAMSDQTELPRIAAGLARDGVELIELCGGVSPRWRPLVSAAAGPQVKVSSVTFGIESLAAALRFNEAYMAGQPPREAYLLLETDADPARDRFVRPFPPQHTTFVPVPDAATAASVAEALVGEGVGLIELYGFSSAAAAAVIDVVRGRAAVGVGAFGLDAVMANAVPAEPAR